MYSARLSKPSNQASKDLSTHICGAHIVAPCPHDGACPLDNTGKYCHLVQRLQRTTSQLAYKARSSTHAVNVRHHRVGESDEPAIYRINDDLQGGIKGIAHITGGGFTDNIPPVFKWIQKAGGIEDGTFNMGIGMVLVVSKEAAKRILNEGESISHSNLAPHHDGKATSAPPDSPSYRNDSVYRKDLDGWNVKPNRTKELASTAIKELNTKELKGKRVRCSTSQAKHKLFIGNVLKSWTLEDIEKVVRKVGPVVNSVELLKDPKNSKRNRGFAFIEYYNHARAEYSRQNMLNPKFKLDDNAPTMSWADPKNAESSASSQVKAVYVKNLPKNVQLVRIQMRVPEYGWTTQKVFHLMNFVVNGCKIVEILPSTVVLFILRKLPPRRVLDQYHPIK
ncbi:hypothetical protein L2E82_30773 [Cichorium intybus]|uniref:Uncharacterized protein n=1 Tax=Cichorium intybus TaxID=13427 RepID=A0ACB9D1M8_CICIN|nr:hypothetical protein L2E82_30773 [Cichorium intybus]